jgi:general nucleoside transport system permease protein
MTATLTEPPPAAGPEPKAAPARDELTDLRRIGIGVVVIILGLVSVVAFGVGSASGLDGRLVLSRGSDAVRIPDVVLPARVTGLVVGAAILFMGLAVVVGLVRQRVYLVLGLSVALFLVALLTWASRGGDTSVIGLIDGTLFRATPLAFGALAGLLCERSGVINIAIEGMLLTSAFMAALTASASDNIFVGVASGMAAGALLGLFLGVLSIRYRVDQIIGGTVINIFALGITSYLGARVLTEYPDLNAPGSFRAWSIPGLERLPLVGPVLFANTIYVYLMFGAVFVIWWGLFRTRWGLRVRSVGEHPRAADTVGINVLRTRYRSVVLGGTVAGFGGTWFTLEATGGFNENMTAGKGYIALAALIFGRWHPVGALIAALVFGFTEELQTRLAVLNTPIPSDFLLMTPYVVTIVVVAGLVGRSRPPAADGQAYPPG